MLFDAAASVFSRAMAIPYGWFSFGSTIIAATVGLFAARAEPVHRKRAAALAGVILGLTDATIGWAVSWLIGPGRVPGGLTPAVWCITAISVTALNCGIAWIGGAVGGWIGRRRAVG